MCRISAKRAGVCQNQKLTQKKVESCLPRDTLINIGTRFRTNCNFLTHIAMSYGSVGAIQSYSFSCGVSILGIQNHDDFCLKVTRFKGNFEIFWNGGMQRWQKWLDSDFQDHFMSKVELIFLSRRTNQILTFFDYFNFRNTLFVKMGPIFVTSTFLHFKKNFLKLGHFKAKIILYNQNWYSTTEVMLVINEGNLFFVWVVSGTKA